MATSGSIARSRESPRPPEHSIGYAFNPCKGPDVRSYREKAARVPPGIRRTAGSSEPTFCRTYPTGTKRSPLAWMRRKHRGENGPRRLAPWQERRAKELIDARLGSEVRLAELAHECELSPGHFARAFKRTTRKSPYRWLLERRIERSQQLLRTSGLPVAEIALKCGFADQSHFTRVFTQTAGMSPRAWQRAHRE